MAGFRERKVIANRGSILFAILDTLSQSRRLRLHPAAAAAAAAAATTLAPRGAGVGLLSLRRTRTMRAPSPSLSHAQASGLFSTSPGMLFLPSCAPRDAAIVIIGGRARCIY